MRHLHILFLLFSSAFTAPLDQNAVDGDALHPPKATEPATETAEGTATIAGVPERPPMSPTDITDGPTEATPVKEPESPTVTTPVEEPETPAENPVDTTKKPTEETTVKTPEIPIETPVESTETSAENTPVDTPVDTTESSSEATPTDTTVNPTEASPLEEPIKTTDSPTEPTPVEETPETSTEIPTEATSVETTFETTERATEATPAEETPETHVETPTEILTETTSVETTVEPIEISSEKTPVESPETPIETPIETTDRSTESPVRNPLPARRTAEVEVTGSEVVIENVTLSFALENMKEDEYKKDSLVYFYVLEITNEADRDVCGVSFTSYNIRVWDKKTLSGDVGFGTHQEHYLMSTKDLLLKPDEMTDDEYKFSSSGPMDDRYYVTVLFCPDPVLATLTPTGAEAVMEHVRLQFILRTKVPDGKLIYIVKITNEAIDDVVGWGKLDVCGVTFTAEGVTDLLGLVKNADGSISTEYLHLKPDTSIYFVFDSAVETRPIVTSVKFCPYHE